MDYIRSCYTTDMRFTTGGTPVSVDWFFAPLGAKHFMGRHRYASLNNARGRFTDDGSIGEVPGAARPWRNGSIPAPYDGQLLGGDASWFDSGCSGHPALAWSGDPSWPIACRISPPPPCVTATLPDRNQVYLSVDGGASWIRCAFIGTDDFQWSSVTVSGHTYNFESRCGLIDAGTPGMQLRTTGGTVLANWASTSVSGSYPQQWEFPTTVGTPAGWPGVTVKMRAIIEPTFTRSAVVLGHNSNSLTVSFGSATDPNSMVVLAYFQNGTDISGGILQVPATPSGWTSHLAATSKRSYVWSHGPGLSISSMTITGCNAADLQHLYLGEWRCPPTASVRGTSIKQAQAANTALTSGSIGDSGMTSAFAWFLVQSRTNPTSQPLPTWSVTSGPFAFTSARGDAVTGGTPLFESLISGLLKGTESAPGGVSGTVTSTRSLGWDSVGLALA